MDTLNHTEHHKEASERSKTTPTVLEAPKLLQLRSPRIGDQGRASGERRGRGADAEHRGLSNDFNFVAIFRENVVCKY